VHSTKASAPTMTRFGNGAEVKLEHASKDSLSVNRAGDRKGDGWQFCASREGARADGFYRLERNISEALAVHECAVLDRCGARGRCPPQTGALFEESTRQTRDGRERD